MPREEKTTRPSSEPSYTPPNAPHPTKRNNRRKKRQSQQTAQHPSIRPPSPVRLNWLLNVSAEGAYCSRQGAEAHGKGKRQEERGKRRTRKERKTRRRRSSKAQLSSATNAASFAPLSVPSCLLLGKMFSYVTQCCCAQAKLDQKRRGKGRHKQRSHNQPNERPNPPQTQPRAASEPSPKPAQNYCSMVAVPGVLSGRALPYGMPDAI